MTGKRHLFLTGTRGAGKSTLLRELGSCPGLVTRAVPGEGVWMGDLQIGTFNPSLPGPENRMEPVNLEKAAALVEDLAEAESTWVYLDEIGYLEAASPVYQQALEGLMEKKRLLAAVRKQELPFLKNLLNRGDAQVIDLDRPFGSLGCVIMASGQGRRFGSNKLLAEVGGEPMIQRVLDASEGIFTRRVVVTRHEAVAELCESRGIQTVLHDLPDRNDTVRLGMEAVGEDLEGCVFCPGDQPLLTRESLEVMALCRGEKILRLSKGGRAGAPVYFPRWCFGELKTLPQGKGGNVLIKKYPDRTENLPAWEEQELWDVDTPQDLERIKKELSF